MSDSKTGKKIIIVGSLLSLVGSGIFFTMPGYLGDVAAALHLSPERVGLLSGAENLAIGISGLLTSLLLTKVGFKALGAAAALCVTGIVLSGLTNDFHSLLLYRFLTGLGEGPLYAMSYIVLGMAVNPDRAFGIALVVTVGVSAAILGVPAPILHGLGTTALLLPTVIAAFLLLPTLRWLPKPDSSAAHAELDDSNAGLLRPMMLLFGMAVWFAAPGMFWAFAETSAAARGVSDASIGIALSLSTLTSLVGPAFPALVGDRMGRTIPFLVCTIGLAGSAAVYPFLTGLTGVALALSVFNICWTGSTVYQMAMTVAALQSGRLAGFAAIAQLAGIAVGGLAGGFLIGAFGYGAGTVGVIGFLTAGSVIFLFAIHDWKGENPNSTTDPELTAA